MPPLYSDEQLDAFEGGKLEWLRRADTLLHNVLAWPFRNEQAEIFARTGLARRLGYLDHALRRLVQVYPPNMVNADRETVRDAELLLQAFIMNVFGAIDNLAWIWAMEREVRGPGGRALYPSEMAFVGGRSEQLRQTLTLPLRNLIDGTAEWFTEIGAFRHGVAHQIPTYIPRLLSNADLAESERLNVAIDAAIEARAGAVVFELIDRRNRLGDYGPYMALNGVQRPMMLHPQLVCDLATLVDLGETLFRELRQ